MGTAGIAVEMIASDGARLPVLMSANVKADSSGQPVLVRITVQDAHDRRSYEQELLEARRRADHERARVQELAATCNAR